MKTLVTGATGLFGANIVRELMARGHEVRALVRQASNLVSLSGLDIEYCVGDIREQSKLREACRGCRYVIHAAGMTPTAKGGFAKYYETNIKGTENIVRAAEQCGLEKIIYVSSCCVFGGGPGDDPGTELSEFDGFKYNSAYINSKYVAQQWVLSEVEKKGLPAVIVNPTVMIGPYDSQPSSGRIILHLLGQRFQLCPCGGKNFIDVRDAAAATCNALTNGRIGESYLLASNNLYFKDFFEIVNRIAGNSCWQVRVPGALLNSFGLSVSLFKGLSPSEIPLDLCGTRQLCSTTFFSGGKAARDLGLQQNPLERAVNDAIHWFEAHKYISVKKMYRMSWVSAA